MAVVTGAASGIGEATAVIFAREGAKGTLVARRSAKLQALAKRITAEGGEALVVQTDVRNADHVQNMARKTVDRFGKPEILFNNAGVRASRCTVVDLTEEEYERTTATKHEGTLVLL